MQSQTKRAIEKLLEHTKPIYALSLWACQVKNLFTANSLPFLTMYTPTAAFKRSIGVAFI